VSIPPVGPQVAERRLYTDRRGGQDRRTNARAERRSTLERRRWIGRRAEEPAAEHIRNAMQLLVNVVESAEITDAIRIDLAAALQRLRRALLEAERPR